MGLRSLTQLESRWLHAQRRGTGGCDGGLREYFAMLRSLLSAVIFLSILSMPSVARAVTPFEPKSVKVDLPDSDKMFPDGPGSEAINNNCLACHSAGMVLNQPALSKESWTAEVNKMIHAYKAPVAPEDVGAIVEYLAGLKGAK
jgi:hypothetical protein